MYGITGRAAGLRVGVSVLLRQPHGFEGPFPVAVDREASDLAVSKSPDVEEAIPHLRIASFHPPAVADAGDYLLLVSVNHLFDLDTEIVKGLPVRAESFL